MISFFAVSGRIWLAAPPVQGDDDAPSERGDELDLDARSLRVLIVEDEFFISLDMQTVVKALGHNVVGIAVSANEAVRIAERERPDVALMDIRLIGSRDGIEAAEDIYSRFGIPSLFVTANTDPLTRARAKAVKPLGFLEKPINPRLLRTGLRKVP